MRKKLNPNKRIYIHLSFSGETFMYRIPKIFRNSIYDLSSKKVRDMILTYFKCEDRDAITIIELLSEKYSCGKNSIINYVVSSFLHIPNPLEEFNETDHYS